MHVITDAGIYYGRFHLNAPASYQLFVPRNFDRLHTRSGALFGINGYQFGSFSNHFVCVVFRWPDD